MKQLYDRNRTERDFNIGDKVMVKLQPYKQHSLKQHRIHKLSPKYYGPYKILDKIRKVAYQLDLPSNSTIHPTFYVSQLKCFTPRRHQVSTKLPALHTMPAVFTKAILDRKMVNKG